MRISLNFQQEITEQGVTNGPKLLITYYIKCCQHDHHTNAISKYQHLTSEKTLFILAKNKFRNEFNSVIL